MSSSYHPQSDGQSEVVNRCLENYLRAFTWQHPQNWSRWLAMAEWWHNTTFHSSINTTPFEVIYGKAPPLYLPYLPQDSCVDAIDRSFTARKEMMRELKTNLQRVQMKQQADKGRSEREFMVGEWVLLKLRSYRQKSLENRALEKLSPLYYGPYEILAKIGKVAYTLKLPAGARIHPTFHVSLLKRCPDPNMIPVHPPEDVAGYRRERDPLLILDRRLVQRKGRARTEVLVQWKDENADEATWEDWHSFQSKFPDFQKGPHP